MLPGSVVTKIFENLVEECTFFSWMSTVLRLWLREGGVFEFLLFLFKTGNWASKLSKCRKNILKIERVAQAECQIFECFGDENCRKFRRIFYHNRKPNFLILNDRVKK